MNRSWLKPCFILLTSLLISTQNCGKLTPLEKILTAQEIHVENHKRCFDDDSVQACLIAKSPVSVEQKSLTKAIDASTDFDYLINVPGVINHLDESGFLQNTSFTVDVARGERAQARNGQWKFLYRNDANGFYSQVHTYYWLDHAIGELIEKTGIFYAEGKNIQIKLNADKTGWNAVDNTIQLETTANGKQAALDASLSIHLLAQANLFYATSGKIYDLTQDANHTDCFIGDGPTYKNDCCKTTSGCSQAIAFGQADYLVALIFPGDPSIGESWANDPQGMKTCALTRNLNSLANRTLQEAFTQCAEKGAPGQIFNMGLIYASTWWEARKRIAKEGADSLKAFDTLYMKHLALIDGKDTFVSALNKVKDLDLQLNSGKFWPQLEIEMQKRGY